MSWGRIRNRLRAALAQALKKNNPRSGHRDHCIKFSELMLHNLRLGILLLVFCLIVGLLLHSCWEYRSELARIRNQTLKDKKRDIVNMVDQAMTQITYARDLLAETGKTEKEIQDYVKERLDTVSFAHGEGYVFVTSYRGVGLVNHARPELVGKKILEMTDFNGVKVVRELINAALSPEGGFVSYVWKKPDLDREVQKISYARGIHDWGWVVGAGVYLDDIDKMVAQARDQLQRSLLFQVLAIVALGGAVRFGLMFLSRRLVRGMHRELDQLVSGLQVKDPADPRLSGERYRIIELQRIADTAGDTLSELERSNKRIAATLYSIGDAVVSTDNEGRVSHMNMVAASLTGWSLAEARGRLLRDVFQIVNGQSQQPVNNPVHHVLTTGKTVELANDTVLIARDGTRRQIADSAAPIRDGAGDITGVVLVFRDVTEKYESQRQLKRFRAALDSSADSLFMIDRGSMRFVDANDTACISLGHERDELLKLGPHEIKPHFSREDLAKRFDLVLRGEKGAGVIESVHVRKDGTRFPVEVRLRGLELEGTSLLIASVRDITEQRRADDDLKQSQQELARSVKELEVFNRAMTGREARIIEMKREVNALLAELGRPSVYDEGIDDSEELTAVQTVPEPTSETSSGFEDHPVIENPTVEKCELDVAYLPVLCSAPLLYAARNGYFAQNGLKVTLTAASGWSGVKDLMAYEQVDAAHVLSPMPLACHLGIDGRRADIRLVAVQNVNGQALTLSKRHEGVRDVRDMKGMTFGVPYRFSMNYYLLCTFLAEHGINPLSDVTILEAPHHRCPTT